MSRRLTLGVRLNNPGLLKKMGNWQAFEGLAAVQDHPIFMRFKTAADGLEALSQVLLNKQVKWGLWNTEQIIGDPLHGFAPPYDNNPSTKYAQFIADRLGIRIDSPVDLVGNAEQHRLFTKAVVAFENSRYAYPDDVLKVALTKGRTDVLGYA